jgi:hypothetical protein
MLALIRMDWTLNRRIVLQLSPLFLLWSGIVTMGMRGLLALSFEVAALLMFLPLFQNLRDTVEPFLLALPVSRAQVVGARFISVFGVMVLVFLAIFLLAWAGHRLGYGWARDVQLGDLAVGLGLQGFLLGAGVFLYLPFHFRFGGDLGIGFFLGSLVANLVTLLLICGWRGLLAHGTTLAQRLLDGGAFLAWVAGGWVLVGVLSVGLSIRAYGTRDSARAVPAVLPTLFLWAVLGLLAAASYW